MTDGQGLLLDTCALLWLVSGTLERNAVRTIGAALERGDLVVSAASAWEVGLLSRAGRLRFAPDPKTWFGRAVSRPGIRLTPVTAEIAIDSSHLPGELHGDPADRLIIATARDLALPVLTRDRRMLRYAEDGHVVAIPC